MGAIANEFGLEPVPVERVPAGFFDSLPRGWSITRHPGDIAYMTPGFSFTQRGPDGVLLFVYWDASQGQLYVLDNQNF